MLVFVNKCNNSLKKKNYDKMLRPLKGTLRPLYNFNNYDDWNVFFVYKLTVSKIFNELNALDDIKFNGVAIYTIPPLDGADNDPDTDQSNDEHEANLNYLGPKLLS